MTQQIQQHMSDNAPKEKAGKGNKKKEKKVPTKKVIKPKGKCPPTTSKANGGPKITPSLRAAMPFPGKPKADKARVPMEYKEFRVYTDLGMGAWRVRQIGKRKNEAARNKVDPKQGWEKVFGLLAQ